MFMMASLRPQHLKCFLTKAMTENSLVYDPTQCSFDKTVDFRRLAQLSCTSFVSALTREHGNPICTIHITSPGATSSVPSAIESTIRSFRSGRTPAYRHFVRSHDNSLRAGPAKFHDKGLASRFKPLKPEISILATAWRLLDGFALILK